MMAYILQVTVSMAVFYAFYHLALRKETLFYTNRMYLLCTFLLSLIIPLIRIYVSSLQAHSVVVQAPLLIGTYLQGVEAGMSEAPASSFSWLKAGMILYFAGVLFLFVRLLVSIRSIVQIKARGKKIYFGDHLCVLSGEIQIPFSFFDTIYLPADHTFSEQELQEVICHEYAHVTGKHSWDVLAFELAVVALWPNPLMYVYRKAIKEVHEYMADAAVIQDTPWETYASMLIAQKRSTLQYQLSNHLIFSQLKNRLIMMTQRPTTFLAKWKYSGILPVLLFALILFSFREKKQNDMPSTMTSSQDVQAESNGAPANQVYNLYTDGLKVYFFDLDNTEKPLFPGCDKVNEMEKQDCSKQKLYAYVAEHLKYPEELKASGIEGKVYVKFAITNNGYVASARIQKSLHPAADKAALDLVNGMNDTVGKWTPGTNEGRPTTMEMVLPISFVLGPAEDKNANPKADQHSDMNSNSNDAPSQKAQSQSASQADTKVYAYADPMPRFPGCEEIEESVRFDCVMSNLFKFIYENIKYPAEDRDKGLEGTVIAQFVVQPDGLIADTKIVRGVSPSMNEEVLRIVNAMNSMPERWIPGMKDGQPVAVQFTLPVKFVLQSENKKTAESMPVEKSEPAQLKETVVTAMDNSKNKAGKSVVEELRLTPNPASDHIVIDLFEGATVLAFFDLGGREVSRKDIAQQPAGPYEFDTTGLPRGQYTVQVASPTRTQSGLLSLVK